MAEYCAVCMEEIHLVDGHWEHVLQPEFHTAVPRRQTTQ